MKVILVTGTPGTGKTTLALELAEKLDYMYLDVNKVIKKYSLSEGYDQKRKSKIIDVKKLNLALLREIRGVKDYNNENLKKKNYNIISGVIIDSHLSHYLPKRNVDLCIVAKCGLNTLKKRLSKRKYPKPKIRENIDSEIFDICYNEALEKGHKVIVVNTTGRPSLQNLIDIIKNTI